MLSNFDKTTPEGRRTLITALGEQAICRGVLPAAATRLFELVELSEYNPGEVIIEQNHASTDVHLILSGLAEVIIDKRSINLRKPGEHIGEMSAIEPAAPRCACVSAQRVTVTARISSRNLLDLADEYPRIWHNLAKTLAARLRERPVRPRNEQARVFLGGSVERLAVTEQLMQLFAYKSFESRPWNVGVCGPSGVVMDDLLREAAASDFAVLSFSEDDWTISRDKESHSPRDNVILEYGLFAGALGNRERVFIVHPRGVDLKLPSDIAGLTAVTYDKNKPLDVALVPVATAIAQVVMRMGPR